MNMRIFFVLLACFQTITSIAQQRLVEFDNPQIWTASHHLDVRQPGRPVVVFENGHGVPLDNWDRVIDLLPDSIPIVTYDRPGIGKSPAAEVEVSLEAHADRLVRLLAAMNLEPPYILVGHSLGGLYVRGFAHYHPEKLAGLIIVDPADFTETWENQNAYYTQLNWSAARVDSLKQSFMDKRMARHEKAPANIGAEGLHLEAMRRDDFNEIRTAPLPNIPVHLLTGGRFDAPPRHLSPAYDAERLFREKMRVRTARWMELVQTVDRGLFFYSARSGHYVQWDDAALVVASIGLVLRE